MGNGKWVMEMGNGKWVMNQQSRITLFLEAPRKRHRIAVAPHLGAVEEAQAQETNAAQRVAFDYHAVDVVKDDLAKPDRVELDAIRGRDAVRGLQYALLAGQVEDSGALGVGGADGDHRSAGVDDEPQRYAVDRRSGEEMAPGIGGEGCALCAGHAAANGYALSQGEGLALASDLDHRRFAGSADELDLFRGRLAGRVRAE